MLTWLKIVYWKCLRILIIVIMITLYFNSNYPTHFDGDLHKEFDSLMLKFILLSKDKNLPINKYIPTNNSPSCILICGKTLKELIDNFKINEKEKYKASNPQPPS